MAARCDKCEREVRTVVPWLRSEPTQVYKVLWHEMPLSREAIYALDPEREAAIPWGEHPDDDRFGQLCLDCAKAMTQQA